MTPTTPPRHVLVTGGAGFIGSHTVDLLLASGRAVTVLDDLSSGRRDNLGEHLAAGRVRLVVGDVRQPLPDELDRAAAERGPFDAVVHLAAQVSVARSMQDPAGDMRTNLGGTLEVSSWARSRGVRRVVFASSAAVYGAVALPADEAAPCLPLSPYGAHKLASEHHLRIAAEAGGPDAVSLRFFNVFGPRQAPGSEYAGVIAVFLARAQAHEAITIHGDGGHTRDFVYVGDVARAIAAALDAPEPQRGAAMNVGRGQATTIRALAEAARAATGSRSDIRHGPERAGDIRHSLAAVRRLEALGWRAETSIEAGLEATARWLAAHR